MEQRPWLSSYDPQVPHTLSYSPSLIYSILERAVSRFPNRTALIFFGFTLTYEQLWAAVQQFAGALQAIGVTRGERVVLLLPNCPQFIIAYFAALQLGAVIVPTNPLYNEQELAFQIRDSEATTLITLDLLFPQVRAVMSDTGLARVIVGKVQDYLPPLKKLLYPIIAQKETEKVSIEERDGVFLFQRLMKMSVPPPTRPELDWNELAVLQYTGGTTGRAKGAMLSHRNIVCNNLQARTWYSGFRDGEEIFISVLPFFHSYGMAVALNLPISVGATMVLFPKFVAKDILKAIKTYQATTLPGIPTIYSVLGSYRDIKKYDISSIRYCVSGAAPLPGTVLHEFETITGGTIIEGYGLSEASPVTHANPVKGIRKEGSIGLPLPDTDCKILDMETGQEVPTGMPGELCIKGPQVMSGYWQRPDETRETLVDGWLCTGDIARMDEQGYFYIVERKKDMIISEGFNVYPREIEEFLLQYPKIADASVVGMPDKLRGEKVYAFVVLREGQQATAEEIIQYCKANLVRYKVPRKVIFRDTIPRNLAGKNLRRVLREEAAKFIDAAGDRDEPDEAAGT
ncbi:MAG: long-chain fatty acid--CoA ligase [Desulfobacterota bacterium]|nr:long-chain fatty acid--CoA ligase [Thermodesulfobacteriota bacterium]